MPEEGEEEELVLFCPRCDRRTYSNWDDLKKHVSEQHPDHDPNWAEEG